MLSPAMAVFAALLFLISLFGADLKAAEIPKGASFELITDIGIKGSKFYLYSPSNPYLNFLMSSMLNSVIFVYPDKP